MANPARISVWPAAGVMAVSLFGALLLGGCATEEQRAAELAEAKQFVDAVAAEAKQAADESPEAKDAKAGKECLARHQRRELKTYRAMMLCYNKAQARIWASDPTRGLLGQLMAYRLVVADQMDRKAITFDEGQLKITQFLSGLQSEIMRRQAVQAQINRQNAAAAAAVNSQNAAAAAAIINAMRPMPDAAPPLLPPPPSLPAYRPSPSINCTSVPSGNTTTTNCF